MLTQHERDLISRGVPFGEAGRALLVREFRGALAELFQSAKLSTFLASPSDLTTGEYGAPLPCMAIGCYSEDQVGLFDAHEPQIKAALQKLGYRFAWITAGMCV